jgi:hypothetical protein
MSITVFARSDGPLMPRVDRDLAVDTSTVCQMSFRFNYELGKAKGQIRDCWMICNKRKLAETRLWAGQPRNRGSLPGRSKIRFIAPQLSHRIWAPPASYLIGSGVKSAGAWSSTYRGYPCVELYLYPPIPKRRFTQHLHGATSQKKSFFVVAAVKTSNPT